MKNKRFIQILLQLFSKFIATFFDQKEKDISPPQTANHIEKDTKSIKNYSNFFPNQPNREGYIFQSLLQLFQKLTK